jgi:hypothetical protein
MWCEVQAGLNWLLEHDDGHSESLNVENLLTGCEEPATTKERPRLRDLRARHAFCVRLKSLCSALL